MSEFVALLGSPRRRGNSTLLAQAAMEAAKEGGMCVSAIRLHGMDIRPCAACEACRRPLGSDCAIRDDMQTVYPQLRGADAILFASPVYWFSLTAQVKLALDRCYALHREGGHVFAGKRVGLILTYGDADCLLSGAMNALQTIRDACRYTGAVFVGAVHGRAGDAGDVEHNPVLMERARGLGTRLATP